MGSQVNRLTTSVTVGFSDSGGSGLVFETYEDPNALPEAGVTYARIFPSRANPQVSALLGAVSASGTDIPEQVEEWISFADASQASLKYEGAEDVRIFTSKFLGEAVVVSYDPSSGSLCLSRSAIGVVQVKYKAYFNKYRIKHNGSPCEQRSALLRSSAVVEADTLPTNYEDAFLVATADGYSTATLSVSGPECPTHSARYPDECQDGYHKDEETGQCVKNDDPEQVEYSGYERMDIAVEVDPECPPGVYPFQFLTLNYGSGFCTPPVSESGTLHNVGCRIRVFTDRPVTLIPYNCVTQTYPHGIKDKPFSEMLFFNGTQSATLKYPPGGPVSLTVNESGIALDGTRINVGFIGCGAWVREVEWLNATTYRTKNAMRYIKDDEVVAVVHNNIAIPCYASCIAEYHVKYRTYEVRFSWNNDLNWYEKAVVLVKDNRGRIGSIVIDPPARKGAT